MDGWFIPNWLSSSVQYFLQTNHCLPHDNDEMFEWFCPAPAEGISHFPSLLVWTLCQTEVNPIMTPLKDMGVGHLQSILNRMITLSLKSFAFFFFLLLVCRLARALARDSCWLRGAKSIAVEKSSGIAVKSFANHLFSPEKKTCHSHYICEFNYSGRKLNTLDGSATRRVVAHKALFSWLYTFFERNPLLHVYVCVCVCCWMRIPFQIQAVSFNEPTTKICQICLYFQSGRDGLSWVFLSGVTRLRGHFSRLRIGFFVCKRLWLALISPRRRTNSLHWTHE